MIKNNIKNMILPEGEIKKAFIFLHGYGSNGQDLLSLSGFFANFMANTAFYSPDAPFACEIGDANDSYQWFSLISAGYSINNPPNNNQDIQKACNNFIDEALAPSKMIDDYIDNIKKVHNLNDNDIYIAGFSQGGFMAIYTGLMRKNNFAGIISFSGSPILQKFAPKIKNKTPVMLIHGDIDEVVNIKALDITKETLSQKEIPFEIKIIPKLGHSINNEALNAAKNFIIQFP